MLFPQFVGAHYRDASVNVASEELCNYYVRPTDSATSRSPFPASLQPRPGIAVFVSGLKAPIRGACEQDGRAFAVGGDTVYELHGDGSTDVLGTIEADELPVTFSSNGHGGHQLTITSAGKGYVYDFNTGALGPITAASFPVNVVMTDFLDGYTIMMQATTSKFFLSGREDSTAWNGADVGQVSSSSNQLMAIRVIQRNLWLLGSRQSEPWVNTGATFPFQPYAGALVEYGIGSVWSLAEADGSILFVGADERGGALVVQSQGFAFKRISNTSVERALRLLPDLSGVRGYTYQEDGHTFYVLCPTVGPCHIYDLSTGAWHTRGVWNPETSSYDPLDQWCHIYAFGKHLVGSRTAGTIYEQSLAYGDDAGTPIRFLRTCPHVNDRQQWIFGSQVTIGCETGKATTTEQTMELSWSKDGGHTYSTPIAASMGAGGDYAKLVKWPRCPGRFQDLVLRTTTEAPVALNSCDLRLDAGTGMR